MHEWRTGRGDVVPRQRAAVEAIHAAAGPERLRAEVEIPGRSVHGVQCESQLLDQREIVSVRLLHPLLNRGGEENLGRDRASHDQERAKCREIAAAQDGLDDEVHRRERVGRADRDHDPGRTAKLRRHKREAGGHVEYGDRVRGRVARMPGEKRRRRPEAGGREPDREEAPIARWVRSLVAGAREKPALGQGAAVRGGKRGDRPERSGQQTGDGNKSKAPAEDQEVAR